MTATAARVMTTDSTAASTSGTAHPPRREDEPEADREDRRQDSPGGVAGEAHDASCRMISAARADALTSGAMAATAAVTASVIRVGSLAVARLASR